MDERVKARLQGMTTGEIRDFELALAGRCPRWKSCDVHRCPLDPVFYEDTTFPDDEPCRARKSTRLRIVAEARRAGVESAEYLPWGGLTGREWTGQLAGERERARFAAMPPEEQAAVRERLRQGRESLCRKRDGTQTPGGP